MKKVLIICLVLAGTTMYAQPPGHKGDGPREERREKMSEFTPQQRAELKTKKMTLDLDLNTTQQAAIQKLNLQVEADREARKKNRGDKKALTAAEKFEHASQRLDAEIAIKKQLKAILTEVQFEKFEKSHDRKKNRRKTHMGRKRD